jgi:Luciferase-like monooxygenase
MTTPLEPLREYVTLLRAALWEGKVDHHGRLYTIETTLPRTPILISALHEGAFQLAGEVADGANSWVCPVQYLLEKAIPALQAEAVRYDVVKDEGAIDCWPQDRLLVLYYIAKGEDLSKASSVTFLTQYL